ncbi:MAG: carboxypeptidase regulatory-like domain-containing protein [Planctomycetes bacterium]|nr:carboxypeptidase regulatory-like domain-containing protein [Planctomycetota bacterium]
MARSRIEFRLWVAACLIALAVALFVGTHPSATDAPLHSSGSMPSTSTSLTRSSIRDFVREEKSEATLIDASVAADAIAAHPPATTTTLHVSDDFGAPIPGASIYASRENDVPSLLARTDARGEAAPVLPSERALALIASAPGFVTSSTPLDDPPQAAIQITLHRGTQITGVVEVSATEPVDAGVRVAAWPVHHKTPTGDELRAALAGNSAVPVPGTSTDEAGRFVIDGLDCGTEYFLVAAGKGYTSATPLVQSKPGPFDVHVPVVGLYGISVVLRDAVTGDLRVSPEVADAGGMAWVMDPPQGCKSLWKDWPHVILAGFPDAHTFDLFFACKSTEPSIGPIPLTITVPGYQRQQSSVFAPRAVSRIDSTDVALTPLSADFGTVDVEVTGVKSTRVARRDERLGFLGVWNESGFQAAIPLMATDHGSKAIRALPYGGYNIAFRTRGRVNSTPPVNFVVKDPSTRVVVDLTGSGSVECHAIERDGKPYEGSLEVETVPEDFNSSPLMSPLSIFVPNDEPRKGPDVGIDYLAPGVYWVVARILKRREDNPAGGPWHKIFVKAVVAAGSATPVLIQLP